MKLADYYKNTVFLNENNISGWATFYYGVFSSIVNANNYKTVAEVGIGYGLHAKQILKETNIDNLYLIDPMQYYPDDAFASDIMKHEPQIPGNNFNELYDLICNELNPWNHKYKWFRKPSLTITNDEIADESLDCIFVDGDHSYQAVLNDLRFWWKKVKVGGKMLGDDYWMNDVSRAVNEFADEIGQKQEFFEKSGTNYKIFCFSK